MLFLAGVCLLLAAADVHGQRMCFNWRSDSWCRSQIDKITANLAAADFYSLSNTCLYNERMKNLYCCTMCMELLGGVSQSMKDASYMYTATPCEENRIDNAYCDRMKRARRCGHPQVKLSCPVTCDYCTPGQTNFFTTAPACVPDFACQNDTNCNVPADTFTNTFNSGTCTMNGTASASTAKGTCETCKDCNKNAKCPKGDSDCGGGYKSCGPKTGDGDGVCSACPTNKTATCVYEAPCLSDQDCGGAIGACMRVTDTVAAATAGPSYTACKPLDANPPTKPSANPGDCTCMWCPNNVTPCKAHGQECKQNNAADKCGLASYCRLTVTDKKLMSQCNVDTATSCTCQCAPSFTTVGDPALQDGKGFPICINGMACKKDQHEECGGITPKQAAPCNSGQPNPVCVCGDDMPKPNEVPSLCDPAKTCTLSAIKDEALDCVSDVVKGTATPSLLTKSNLLASVCQPTTNTSEFICQCDVQVPQTSVRVGATCYSDSVASDKPSGYCPNGTFCSLISDTTAKPVVPDNAPCTIPKQMTGTAISDKSGCQCADLATAKAKLDPDYSDNKQRCYSDWAQICGYGDCVKYSDMKTPCATATPAPKTKQEGELPDGYPTDAAATPLTDADCVCKMRQCHAGAECSLAAPAFGASAATTECGPDDSCKGKCACK